MGTRCWGRRARAVAGAAGFAAAGAGVAGGAAADAAASASFLVMRPPGADPGTDAGARLFCCITRRAAGPALDAAAPALDAADALLAIAVAAALPLPAAADDAGDAGDAALAVAEAASSMTASNSPLFTDVPLRTLISRSTPLIGAGTSSTTLSVSRSARFSSRLTASPGFLRHAMRVASATDSGNCG